MIYNKVIAVPYPPLVLAQVVVSASEKNLSVPVIKQCLSDITVAELDA